MDLVASRKRRRAERRAEEQAKARSDEIDLHLKEEAKSCKEQCDVLLISSYPHIGYHTPATCARHSNCVDKGIPESEATAFALVKRMKIVHEAYTHEELTDFRPVIWRILLHNSRSVVMAMRSKNLGPVRRSNKVRSMFYIFISCCRRFVHTGKLRVHCKPPDRQLQS